MKTTTRSTITKALVTSRLIASMIRSISPAQFLIFRQSIHNLTIEKQYLKNNPDNTGQSKSPTMHRTGFSIILAQTIKRIPINNYENT